MKKHTIWIINGPNLNLLHRRPASLYGGQPFEDYLQSLRTKFPQLHLPYFQSNSEGALIDQLHSVGFSADGIVFNPAAYTHTSIALADAVELITSPVVEVHITDIYRRQPHRHTSFLRPHCIDSITGHGLKGYEMAIQKLLQYIETLDH